MRPTKRSSDHRPANFREIFRTGAVGDNWKPEWQIENFMEAGHEVAFLNKMLARGSSDHLVCAIAGFNAAILVALDGDMKRIAQGHGVGTSKFLRLGLIKAVLLRARRREARERSHDRDRARVVHQRGKRWASHLRRDRRQGYWRMKKSAINSQPTQTEKQQ
jgi:hypothetical protein